LGPAQRYINSISFRKERIQLGRLAESLNDLD
jgi:hypothetical protein